MSKSLKRVEAAIEAVGLKATLLEMEGDCTTAQAAADTLNVTVDQIAKSVLLIGQQSRQMYLFVTAGTNQVDSGRAEALTQEPLERPGAALIRSETGFAIGGVSPLGHRCPITSFFDGRLLDFDTVWAAAGTPRHVFSAAPAELMRAIAAKHADFVKER